MFGNGGDVGFDEKLAVIGSGKEGGQDRWSLGE